MYKNYFLVHTCTGGLNDQFSTHKCIVDYMIQYPDEEENIFDNFLTLFLQVFKGLGYLHSKKIVHGDVKGVLSYLRSYTVSNFWCII